MTVSPGSETMGRVADGAPVYRERRLADVAGTLWATRHDAGCVLVLPDGCMDLIWTGSRLLVAGPDTRPHPYRSEVAEQMVGLRLDPGVAPGVLGVPAEELRDRRVELADLWPHGQARRWAEMMADADDPSVVLHRLAGLRRWERPAWLAPVASALTDGISVDDCADRVGVSPRTLHRHSVRYFGYGPKTLQRILRLRAAMADLAAGQDISAVAYRRNFADHPHMHREFLELAGRGPATFVL